MAGESAATSATIGNEGQVWRMADGLRRSRDAGEDRCLGGGLSVLKYTSGGFVVHFAKLLAEQAEGGDPEEPGVYSAMSSFWVPAVGGRVLGPSDTIGRSVT